MPQSFNCAANPSLTNLPLNYTNGTTTADFIYSEFPDNGTFEVGTRFFGVPANTMQISFPQNKQWWLNAGFKGSYMGKEVLPWFNRGVDKALVLEGSFGSAAAMAGVVTKGLSGVLSYRTSIVIGGVAGCMGYYTMGFFIDFIIVIHNTQNKFILWVSTAPVSSPPGQVTALPASSMTELISASSLISDFLFVYVPAYTFLPQFGLPGNRPLALYTVEAYEHQMRMQVTLNAFTLINQGYHAFKYPTMFLVSSALGAAQGGLDGVSTYLPNFARPVTDTLSSFLGTAKGIVEGVMTAQDLMAMAPIILGALGLLVTIMMSRPAARSEEPPPEQNSVT